MGDFNNSKEMVPIKGLVCVVESEKAYGILTKDKIIAELDPGSVTSYEHIKDRFSGKLVWIPKSQVKDAKYVQDNTFPNLLIAFKSKYNPVLIPYKTGLEISMPKWLAENNGFIPSSKSKESNSNYPNVNSNNSNDDSNLTGW